MKNRTRQLVLLASVAALALGTTALSGVLSSASAAVGPPPGVIVDYLSDGWKYQQVAVGEVPGFESPSFDDSSWPTGQAGFGSLDGTCPWNTPTQSHTQWDTFTDILVRRHFGAVDSGTVPHLSGTIDNVADVYLNGTLIFHVDSGFCDAGTIDVDLPVDLLTTDNVLAIRGNDYGLASFLDVQLTGTLAEATTVTTPPTTTPPATASPATSPPATTPPVTTPAATKAPKTTTAPVTTDPEATAPDTVVSTTEAPPTTAALAALPRTGSPTALWSAVAGVVLVGFGLALLLVLYGSRRRNQKRGQMG